ncbi:MAG: tetratricopeptide repeat protein [Verrucomicrobiota bacterium]|nr:tetratricopeptide repeat protein [Verrucomicrobiota bacterium]
MTNTYPPRLGLPCLFAYLALTVTGCLSATAIDRQSPSPTALAAYGLACTSEINGDLDQALRFIGIAINADGTSPELHIQHGRLLSLREQWTEAADALEKALELQPDNLEALRFKAILALKTERPEDAIADYREALAIQPDDLSLHLELAQIYHAAQRIEEAIEVLRIAREKAPDDFEILVALGEMDFEAARLPGDRVQGKREHYAAEAVEVFLAAAERDPENGRIWLRLVDLAQITGELDLAIRSCRKVLEFNPEFHVVRQRLAQTLAVKGELEEAIEQADILREQEPLNTDFINLAGALYWRVDRRDEALALMQESIEIDPRQTQLRVELGEHLMELDRYADAVGVMEGAGSDGEQSPQLQYLLGLGYIVSNRLAEARTAWDRYVALLSERGVDLRGAGEFYVRYGLLLQDLDDWSAAAEMFEKAVEAQPDNLMVCREFAVSLFRAGQEDRARDVIGHAAQRVQLPPFQIALFKAQFALDIDDFATASQEFEDVVSLASNLEEPLPDAELARIFFLAGAANERASAYQRSVDLLRRSIELDPQYPEALNYLGYMMAERGEDLLEAKSLIERALELSPENGAYLDSLGWALYRLGDLNGALENLLKAQESIDDDPVVFEHLGDVYWDLGQLGRARSAWNRALELDPGNQDIQRKLDEKGATEQVPEDLKASSNGC